MIMNFKRIFFMGMVSLSIFSCKNSATQEKSALDFNPDKYELREVSHEGKTFQVRAYEGIIYVANPVDSTYQKMNIYIPQDYFEGKSIEGYTAETAPVFFPNNVGGYMPAEPAMLRKLGDDTSLSKRPNTVATALSKGYVVASAGARGRTLLHGKAPAVIIDLKAAVRYLRFNDKKMPGDAEKIISNGTSAGGAVSALLGATGNHKAYEPYLKELGAAQTSDAIFAVSAYCPITNLDNADKAYEWQFYKVPDYKKIDVSMLDYKMERKEVSGTLSPEEQNTSDNLNRLFPEYLNNLQLKDKKGALLTSDNQGNGNFKELVKAYIIASAQKEQKKGTDMSSYAFLKIENGQIVDLDFEQYIAYMGRQKLPPAFDALDLSSGENDVFGDSLQPKKHFTEYALQHSSVQGSMADPQIVWLMNPMNFIGKEKVDAPKHWRIRHGSKDKDTGLAIAVLLGTLLENNGYNVDLAFPWDKPHSGDYDLDELFDWIKSIAK